MREDKAKAKLIRQVTERAEKSNTFFDALNYIHGLDEGELQGFKNEIAVSQQASPGNFKEVSNKIHKIKPLKKELNVINFFQSKIDEERLTIEVPFKERIWNHKDLSTATEMLDFRIFDLKKGMSIKEIVQITALKPTKLTEILQTITQLLFLELENAQNHLCQNGLANLFIYEDEKEIRIAILDCRDMRKGLHSNFVSWDLRDWDINGSNHPWYAGCRVFYNK